jgi:predicted dehydrogenase
MARMSYRAGDFGEFRIGEAKMIEPYFYRNSNFQNWFTCDQTDPFVYVGCHYVDLVHFITGLKPESVSVNGVKGKFPNGKEGYMWANGRVVWENGAVLNVTGGLGYPDKGAGANDQGLYMICEGDGCSGLIKHNDQHRGVEYSYLTGKGSGGSHFNYVSPDYFRLIPWEGEGLRPTGYGYESVRAIIMSAIEVEESAENRLEHEGVETCRHTIDKINKKGLIATPANSSINEMVIEAARESILNKGKLVKCERVK